MDVNIGASAGIIESIHQVVIILLFSKKHNIQYGVSLG